MSGAIGSVFLGLTVGCARCHNHKFDPILQSDYYRLQAIFASTELKDVEIATPTTEGGLLLGEERLRSAPRSGEESQIDEIEKRARGVLHEKKLAELEPKLRDALDIPKDKRTRGAERRSPRMPKSRSSRCGARWWMR